MPHAPKMRHGIHKNKKSFVFYVTDKCCFTMATLLVAIVTSHIFALVIVYNMFMFHLDERTYSKDHPAVFQFDFDSLNSKNISEAYLKDLDSNIKFPLNSRGVLQLKDTDKSLSIKDKIISRKDPVDITKTPKAANSKKKPESPALKVTNKITKAKPPNANLTPQSLNKTVEVVEVNMAPPDDKYDYAPELDLRENDLLVVEPTKPPVNKKPTTEPTEVKVTPIKVTPTKVTPVKVSPKKRIANTALKSKNATSAKTAKNGTMKLNENKNKVSKNSILKTTLQIKPPQQTAPIAKNKHSAPKSTAAKTQQNTQNKSVAKSTSKQREIDPNHVLKPKSQAKTVIKSTNAKNSTIVAGVKKEKPKTLKEPKDKNTQRAKVATKAAKTTPKTGKKAV